MDKTIRVSGVVHEKVKRFAAATGQTLGEFTESALLAAVESGPARELLARVEEARAAVAAQGS